MDDNNQLIKQHPQDQDNEPTLRNKQEQLPAQLQNPPSSITGFGSVSSNAAAAILQNNGMRKSLQVSASGLKQLTISQQQSNQQPLQSAQPSISQQQNSVGGGSKQNQNQTHMSHNQTMNSSQQSNQTQAQSTTTHSGGVPNIHHSSDQQQQLQQLNNSHIPSQSSSQNPAQSQLIGINAGQILGQQSSQYHGGINQGRPLQQQQQLLNQQQLSSQQMGLMMQQSHLINGNSSANGQSNMAAISQSYGVGASMSNGAMGIQNINGAQGLLIQHNGSHSQKYNNGGQNLNQMNGVNMMNHKQFSMSTQQGLFPKINNIRMDNNQTVPNSAHSNNQNIGVGQSNEAMNVLKNSGGHISGMSNSNDRHYYRGANGIIQAINSHQQNSLIQHQFGQSFQNKTQVKPLSSPRQSKKQSGNVLENQQNFENEKVNDPNYLYQQQLQWKTKSSMNNNSNEGEIKNSGQSSETANAKNVSLSQNQVFTSPGPVQPNTSTTAQLLFEQQRAKQISGGSEKRLKMHQQRQYYSEQYRVQQQRQHQQTANAVLSQNSTTAASGTHQAQIGAGQGDQIILQRQQEFNNTGKSINNGLNYRVQQFDVNNNMQEQLNGGKQNEYSNLQSGVNRTGQIHAQQYAQINGIQNQPIAQQMYTHQRQRQQKGLIKAQNMHNTQLVNQQGPQPQLPIGSQLNGVAQNYQPPSNQQLVGMTPQQIQTNQLQNGVNLQMNNPNISNQNKPQRLYSENGQHIFFRKRSSSNTNNPHLTAQAALQSNIAQNQNKSSGQQPSESKETNLHQSPLPYQNKSQSENSKMISPKNNNATMSLQNHNQVPQYKTQGQTFQIGQTGTQAVAQQANTQQSSQGVGQQPQQPTNISNVNNIQQNQQQLQNSSNQQQPAQPPNSSSQKPTTNGQPSTTSQPAQGSGTSGSQQQSSSNANGQQTQQQQQQQPKIPVICGFHKRILLITCQNNSNSQNGQVPGAPGQQNMNGMSSNSQMNQARRVRNKNPNCNHNSNSVFYQPHYNNVKYDDSHKKKEDVLRKVFFKECAKEEEKRLYNGSSIYQASQFGSQGITGQGAYNQGPNEMARQQAFSQANDPNKHLQIIERILCEYLFVAQPFDRNQKQQLTNTQSLMMELGLDRALTPHRAFLLALIRAGKFNSDNMLKVLSEVKTSATDFDNECIYCKYSQYALKESAKLLQKHQAALQEQSQNNPQQALAIQQQIQANGGIIKGPSGEDIRIENLVRMFQSQLFKKSFINTSLMIIQRKMTEKYFQKYHNAKQAQQAQANQPPGQTGVQYGPDGKPIDQPKKPAKKTKPKNQQNLSSLEYLSKEIQKLSKNLANPKDKERYLELKEKYYREFLIKILKSNGVEKIQFPTASFPPYKYYIGRGNNSGIVRTALKSRYWWSMGDYDDWDDYNFVWTQWKSNKILNCLKPYKELQDIEHKENHKKRSSQSTRTGGQIDSQLTTQATDKESNSSKENLINTPKKNKLASSTLGNTSSELNFKRQNISSTNSANKSGNRIQARGKKGEDKDDEKEENHTSHNQLYYSKMENNYHLSNKKAIYYNMKVYYEALGQDYYKHLPLTFHIKEGLNDPQFLKFEQLYQDLSDNTKPTILESIPKFGKNLWIVKPGENTNRGCGIQVSKDLEQIKSLVQNTNVNGNKRSFIIQKYIEKPLLYKNRKFDIRCFTLMCTINGNLQGYWYQEGYLRTSCREFTLKNVSNRYVHLTNDAVQKKLDDYGKFESGNKLSYSEFQKYLDTQNIKCDFMKDIQPKMKNLAQDSMRAVSRKLDPDRKAYSCEIFGYDFMIDEDLNVWMIEVNTNPCFELSSPYLARLIPSMIENALKIAVDPIFPPPPVPNSKKHSLPDAQDNKFDLIFNEREDAGELKNLPIDDNMNGIIEEEEMEEEGSDNEEEEDEKE